MDYTLNINVDGAQADRKLDNLVKELNESQKAAEQSRKTQQRLATVRRELANYAKKEREEAFSKLSIEEKTNRLLERREQIARRLATAATDERRLMLRLAQRRNEGRLSDLQGESAGAMLKDQVLGRMFLGIPGGGFLQNMVGKMGAGRLAGAGAGLLAGYGAKKGLDAAGDVADLADRLDMTIQEVQKIAFAAHGTGGDVGSFTRIIENIRKNRSEALQGNPAAQKDFHQLGINPSKTGPEDIFYKITGDIKTGLNPNAYSSALQVMGKEAREQMPAFKNGVKDAADEFDRLNLSIRSGTIRALDDLGDKAKLNFSIVGAGLKKVGVETLGGAVSLGKLLTAKGLDMTGLSLIPAFGKVSEDLELSRSLQNDPLYNSLVDRLAKAQKARADKDAGQDAFNAHALELAGKEPKRQRNLNDITITPDRLEAIGGIRGSAGGANYLILVRQELQKLDRIEKAILDFKREVKEGIRL